MVAIGDDNEVFVLYFFDGFFLDLSVLLFLQLILLWVVSWRYLNDGINNHVEVRLLFSGLLNELLINSVESFRVDAFGEVGVLFGPVLENSLEIGTDFVGLLHDVFGFFVEVELDAVADDHQVQNEAFVLGLVVGVANYVFDKLDVIRDKFFLDVPVCFFNHVGHENDLDLIEQENFSDGLENLVNRVLGTVLTGLGDAVEEGIDPPHVIFGVETEEFGVLGRGVIEFIFLFVHF